MCYAQRTNTVARKEPVKREPSGAAACGKRVGAQLGEFAESEAPRVGKRVPVYAA